MSPIANLARPAASAAPADYRPHRPFLAEVMISRLDQNGDSRLSQAEMSFADVSQADFDRFERTPDGTLGAPDLARALESVPKDTLWAFERAWTWGWRGDNFREVAIATSLLWVATLAVAGFTPALMLLCGSVALGSIGASLYSACASSGLEKHQADVFAAAGTQGRRREAGVR